MKYILAFSLGVFLGCNVRVERQENNKPKEAETQQPKESATQYAPSPPPPKLPPSATMSENFEKPSLYVVGGSKSQRLISEGSGSFLRLAFSETSGQENTISFPRTVAGVPETIIADFDFRFQASSGCIADGIGFALLNTSDFGESGPVPDFAEEPNLKGSFGVGFDIYDNGELLGANHVSLHCNEALLQNFDPTFSLVSGVFHHAKITLTAIKTGFTVDVTLTPGGGMPVEVVSGFVVASPLYESRIAFGARVGACSANQDIDNISVRFTGGTLRDP